MTREPLRLPAWAWAILSTIAVPVAVALLTDGDWRKAAAAGLLTLIPAAGTVGAAEAKRAFTDSPATRAATAARKAGGTSTVAQQLEDTHTRTVDIAHTVTRIEEKLAELAKPPARRRTP